MNLTITDAKPYPFTFAFDKTALMIIDMQRDFLQPGGFGSALGNDVALLNEAVPAIAGLLNVFRRSSLPVIHSREAHRPDLSDCPPAKRRRGSGPLHIGDPGPMGRLLVDGERGSEYIDELRPVAGETEIIKPGKGAFYATDLSRKLEAAEIRHLLITGVTTEVCVQTTMREANDRGYECLLIEDATQSYFPSFKKATLDMVVAQGAIVGWTATSDEVIQCLEAAC